MLYLLLHRYPLGVLGALIWLVLLVPAVVPGCIATASPTDQDPARALEAPSRAHRFGTDNFGRDVFSRIVFGTRNSLVVALGATALATALALITGMAAAFGGGWFDALVQRLVDAVMALPWLVLALSMLVVVGPGRRSTLLVLGVLAAPGLSRVVRAGVLRLRALAFVDAARALGATPPRILFRHLLPNLATELLVLVSLTAGNMLLAEASLSFLGLGVVPPAPAWGYMLGVEGRRFLTAAPWLAIFPGLMIALAVFAATVTADALRDALDPRR